MSGILPCVDHCYEERRGGGGGGGERRVVRRVGHSIKGASSVRTRECDEGEDDGDDGEFVDVGVLGCRAGHVRGVDGAGRGRRQQEEEEGEEEAGDAIRW